MKQKVMIKNKISCIYKISSILKPDRFYIGSSCNFGYRKDKHRTFLKKNRHTNMILQNHYNKYGIDDIKYEILELVDGGRENLLLREQFYFDTLNPTFNILKVAGSPIGYKMSEEAKRKLSISLKNRIISDEERADMSNRMRGNKYRVGILHSDEIKKQMSKERIGNKFALGCKHSEEANLIKSKINKGKFVSEETREKISKIHKGKKLSKEQIEVLSKAHLGKKLSKESVEKRTATRKLKGYRHSKETITKMSETHRMRSLLRKQSTEL